MRGERNLCILLIDNKGKEWLKGKKVYIDFKNGYNKNYWWIIFNILDIIFYYWLLIYIYRMYCVSLYECLIWFWYVRKVKYVFRYGYYLECKCDKCIYIEILGGLFKVIFIYCWRKCWCLNVKCFLKVKCIIY